MARSVSFDFNAVDKASATTKRLGDEVDALGRKIERAGGTIEVDADTARAEQQLARLAERKLRVDADISEAQRTLAVLAAEAKTATGDRKIEVDADIDRVQAKLRSLQSTRTVIDIDTIEAERRLDRIRGDLGRVGGSTWTARVRVEAGQALRELDRIGATLRNLGSAVKPVGVGIALGSLLEIRQAVLGVGAGLFGIGAAAASGAAVAKGALVGIEDAVTALGEKDTSTMGRMQSNARAVASAVHQVELAHRALRNANESVADAQREVENTAYDIVQAQTQVARATERVRDAQTDLTRANEDALDAERDLNEARQVAADRLRDLERREQEMQGARASAAISVMEAQERLQAVMVDPRASDTERARAALNLAEAQRRTRTLAEDERKLKAERAEAQAKGVEGSDEVRTALDRQVDAARRVEQATRAVRDAQNGVADAARRVVDAQRQHESALRGVRDAQESVKDAAWNLRDAQAAVREASQQAGTQGSAAANKLQEAMSKLTPEGQRFAKFLRGLLDNEIKDLKDTSQSAFLPGLQAGIKGFFDNIPGAKANIERIGRNLGSFFEQIGPSAGRAADAFLRIAGIASDKAFGDLADTVEDLLDRFTVWANSKSEDEINRKIQDIEDGIESFVGWVGKLNTALDILTGAWKSATGQFGIRKLFTDDPEKILDYADNIANFGQHLPFVGDKYKDLKKDIDKSRDSMHRIKEKSDETREAQERLRDETKRLSGEFLGIRDSESGYFDALDRTTEALRRNGAGLDVRSRKGRENRDTLDDQAEATLRYIDKLRESGSDESSVERVREAGRQQLIRNAKQFGMTGKEAEAYADKLFGIPKERSTTIKTPGATAAKAHVDDFREANRLAGKQSDQTQREVTSAWEKIRDKAKTPIRFTIDTVMGGLARNFNTLSSKIGGPTLPVPKSGFAMGGVLPGYTPGRDVHRFVSPTAGVLDLSGGEAFMRPEFTKAMGGERGIRELNELAKKGELPDMLGPRHSYAGGGVVDWIKSKASSAWDWVRDTGSSLYQAASHPWQYLSGDRGNAAATPGDGFFQTLAKSAGTSMVGSAVNKLSSLWGAFKSAFDSSGVSGAFPTGGAGIGMGWQAQAAWIRKNLPGVAITSTYRPGAVTVSGNTSYHARGRAVDLAPSMDTFNAIKSSFGSAIRELIYSPAGSGQVKNGTPYFYGGAVRNMHWNHVHWAMKNGGVFDNGGLLQPGLSMVYNGTGEPEPVLTSQQWNAGMGSVNIHVTVQNAVIGNEHQVAKVVTTAVQSAVNNGTLKFRGRG